MTTTSRSSTAWVARRSWRSACWRTLAATPVHGRFGSATAPIGRSSTTFGGPSSIRSTAHPVSRLPARARLADTQEGRRGRHRPLARAGPWDLGGTGRAQAFHVLQGHVLGGGRPGSSGGPAARRRLAGGTLAEGG